MTNSLTSYQDVCDAVGGQDKVLARGAGTKPALSRVEAEDVQSLDLTALTGVEAYDPSEFVLTAKAGTPLREIAGLLEEHHQYMPFDPPFIEAGATIGGTVAAGLSGPGRLRFGGLRDFLLGVRFVDGTGTLVKAGGKVVKNAAGFDLPKLLIGSLGRLGVLVELTVKVFPRPPATTTLQVSGETLDEAVETMCRVAMGPWEIAALDLAPPAILRMRMGGHPEALAKRFARLRKELNLSGDLLTGDDDRACWQDLRDCTWADNQAVLMKIPLTPRRVASLDDRLHTLGAIRRYSVAGNVAWVGLDESAQMTGLESELQALGLAGLVIRGDVSKPRWGVNHGEPMERLIKETLDPGGRFPS